jgi:Arc/MetJ-type ribon-helix-helix transcriptional regulator
VRLRPEIEKLIQADLKRGAYNSLDEYVERAVAVLHEQETWLAENRDNISAQIEEGYAAARRGELIEADEVRSRMKERKSNRPPE